MILSNITIGRYTECLDNYDERRHPSVTTLLARYIWGLSGENQASKAFCVDFWILLNKGDIILKL